MRRISWRSLLWRILLLTETARLLSRTSLLLTESPLPALVHLSGRSSHLRSANGRRLVRSAEQDVLLVHHRIVDELPLVVGLLLVVDADGGIFAQAGHADDGSAPKCLGASGWIRSRRRASLLLVA